MMGKSSPLPRIARIETRWPGGPPDVRVSVALNEAHLDGQIAVLYVDAKQSAWLDRADLESLRDQLSAWLAKP